MKVIILMSVYNGENFIEEQLNSIFSQTGDFEIEVWVRDDGSKDGTISILKKYEEGKKLYWYSGKNLKPAHSFMDLIMHSCKADYYAFSDQDDVWLNDKLKRSIKRLENISGIPAIYCSNAELVDENLNSLGRTVFESIPRTDLYTLSCAGGLLGCTMVFNNQLAEIIKNSKMPQKIVMHDFFISELCLAVGGKIIYEPEVTIKYRQHENNVIGVSHGIVKTIRERFKDMNTYMYPGISEQSKEILSIYFELINSDAKKWLRTISTYKKSLYKRIKLATSKKTRYANWNLGLKNRIAILKGNR